MNRPDNILAYDELDLKLGIKSSLPHVKGTLGLAILLWECSDHPSELDYAIQENDGIVLKENIKTWMFDYVNEICEEDGISHDDLVVGINQNQLFKSQLEALIVAFELVWKLAKVTFTDGSKPSSAERTGGIRYPKKLSYSVNVDIIHTVIAGDENAFIRVLMAWMGFKVNFDSECEKRLTQVLTALSEGAVFKLTDGDKDVIFNQNSIYRKLNETNAPVDINGDKEAKGPLRILKSLLADGLNPYLDSTSNGITVVEQSGEVFEEYQKRVDTFLRLSATKVIGLDDLDTETEGLSLDNVEETRLTTGMNILLYGVPGAGKSWTIEHEYCKKGTKVERLVFHPDYTYSDFVGQILPDVAENGQISYRFMPGPFTTILCDAYHNPTTEYILVIEEINRGNAPAIFGEVFQLLDRKFEIAEKDDNGFPIGTSEYGITNANIAKVVYDDPTHKVRVPSNLSIIGTMNTSDQNVFTLDTAFQRRWNMRLIENSFADVKGPLKTAEILDTGITWRVFCTEINKIIAGNNARMTSSEDKRLGTYFVHLSDLIYDDRAKEKYKNEYALLKDKEDNDSLSETEELRLAEIRAAIRQNRKFPEKVIKYLWDDAFKFNREAIFDTTRHSSLESVIRVFISAEKLERLSMFKQNVVDAFTSSTE